MIRKVVLATFALFVFALTGASALADDLLVYRGVAEAAGPVTLSLAGKRILLWGIDAPVRGQPCYAENKTWDCGTASAKTRSVQRSAAR